MNKKGEKTKQAILQVIKQFHEKGIIPYQSQLEAVTGFSHVTIIKHIKLLEREGVIETWYQNNRKYIKLKDANGDLKPQKNRQWKGEEIEFLKRTYGKMPTIEIVKALGRSMNSVYRKARQLKLTNRRRGCFPKYLKNIVKMLCNQNQPYQN